MNSPAETAVIGEIVNDIRANRLVVLAGAGISAAPPACVPLFRPLRDVLLKALISSVADRLTPGALKECGQIFAPGLPARRGIEPVPEVLFDALYTPLKEQLFVVLRLLLGTETPNSQHEFLSGLLGEGVRLLLTTNFEECFEKALDQQGKTYVVHSEGQPMRSSAKELPRNSQRMIWKIHGSLEPGQEASIRVTLSQIGQERYDQDKFASLAQVARHFPILVVGYSGYDADVSRALLAAAKQGRTLYWLSLRSPAVAEPAHTILAGWTDKGRLLVGNLAELLQRISERLPERNRFIPPSGECGNSNATRESQVLNWARQLPVFDRFFALGTLTWKLGAYDACLEILQRLEEDAIRQQRGNALLAMLLLRTNVLRDAGRLGEMKEVVARLAPMQQAARLSGTPFDNEVRCLILWSLGADAEARFEFAEAERNYREAKRLASQAGLSMEGTIDQSLAALLGRTGRFDEPGGLLEAALTSARRTGDREAEARARHELAIIAFEAQNYDQAEEAFKENLQLVREIGNLVLEQATLFELGIVALRAHRNHDEARGYIADSLKLSELQAQPRQRLRSLIYLAEIDQEQERHTEAVDGFGKCAALAQEIGDPESLCMALTRRARSYALQENFSAAKLDLDTVYPIAQKLQSPFLQEINALRPIVSMMASR